MTDAQIRMGIFPTSRKVLANFPHCKVMVKLGELPTTLIRGQSVAILMWKLLHCGGYLRARPLKRMIHIYLAAMISRPRGTSQEATQ